MAVLDSNSADASVNLERSQEAYDILFKLGLAKITDMLDARSARFVEDMCERFDKYGTQTFVSLGQIGWLRDLKDNHL